MSAPPASPRRRRWQPPGFGAGYILPHNGSLWRVYYQLDRASRQVCLKAVVGGQHRWVNADDLKRDWTAV